MEFLASADFWIGLFKIVWIDILLSGDNAVVIALAARSLPARQQRQAIVLGSAAAVVLRVTLTLVAAKLLGLPFLQVVGGGLLLWIGYQLITGEEDSDAADGPQSASLFTAIRTILLADLVMSLDNVIAVAAAAQGDMVLLIMGLAISIPLMIFGSRLMIKLMERFPWIVTLGAGLIGWVAGETIMNDHLLRSFTEAHPWMHYAAAAMGAVLVVAVGRGVQQRRQRI